MFSQSGGFKFQSNIAIENGPFEDVFPIENGDIPASYVSLPEGRRILSKFFAFSEMSDVYFS